MQKLTLTCNAILVSSILLSTLCMYSMETTHPSPETIRKNHINQMIEAAKNNNEMLFQNLLTNAPENNHADVLEPVIYLLPNKTLEIGYATGKILPYAMAVYKGNKETIDQAKIKYLKNPADKDSINLLHLTACHNHPLSIAELLLAQDFSLLNSRDAMGATPLLYTALSNNIAMCKYLLSFKEIDQDLKNNKGFTPSAIAIECGHKEIITLFQDHPSFLNILNKEISPK